MISVFYCGRQTGRVRNICEAKCGGCEDDQYAGEVRGGIARVYEAVLGPEGYESSHVLNNWDRCYIFFDCTSTEKDGSSLYPSYVTQFTPVSSMECPCQALIPFRAG
uniref:Uncharacterized protein n=1 Tax=Amorphochlora amoebiformis TaxID=1561963 RepID=A0A7S0GUN3_9EUKA